MQIKLATSRKGVDVAIETSGNDRALHDSIRCLKRRGTCVMFGASSGQVEGIAPLELAEAGSVFFTRPHLADYLQAHEVRQRAAELFALVADDRLSVAIERTYGLDEVADAHRHIEGRNTKGKLLVSVAA